MRYRRHLDSETWHFSPACSQWPRDFDFIISDQLRRDAQVCPECATESICELRMLCEKTWDRLKRIRFNFDTGPSALAEAEVIVADTTEKVLGSLERLGLASRFTSLPRQF